MTNIKRAILASITAVVATLGLSVGLASAHNGTVTASCVNQVPTATANLTNYNGTNAITIKNDGSELTPGTFTTAYQHSFNLGSPYIAHVVVFKVTAHDDTTNSHGWSPGGTINVPACKQIQHQPVTLCHNGHKIMIDDDAVVKQGHDNHSDDIIPSFSYIGDDGLSHTYPGKNLDKIGLLQTGCTESPTHEPKVVTVDVGQPQCGDTSVATQTTTTTYTYTYVDGQWVEHTKDTVTSGSREIEATPCPTEPPTTTTPPDTTVPATTVPPTTVPPTTVTPTVPTTVAVDVPPVPAPVTPVSPTLPVTGGSTTGLLIAVIMVITGIVITLVAARRKPRNA